MSEIVDHLVPDSLLLFNESFAATNDREGSEIARQIVSALLEKGIKVFFVTHLYDFAHRFHDKNLRSRVPPFRFCKLRKMDPYSTLSNVLSFPDRNLSPSATGIRK